MYPRCRISLKSKNSEKKPQVKENLYLGDFLFWGNITYPSKDKSPLTVSRLNLSVEIPVMVVLALTTSPEISEILPASVSGMEISRSLLFESWKKAVKVYLEIKDLLTKVKCYDTVLNKEFKDKGRNL